MAGEDAMDVDVVAEIEDEMVLRFEEGVQLVDNTPDGAIKIFRAILEDARVDEAALKLKEQTIYKLGGIYAAKRAGASISALLKECNVFFSTIPKAKTAKIVRTLIDMVSRVPDSIELQVVLCKECIEWCTVEKRSFLRQRIESRLATLYFEKKDFHAASAISARLVNEVKKLDDKQLLVEVHLVEARVQHALKNLPKARASLTAARSNANSIYVVPRVQAYLDQMSGTVHAEERDYKTAYSYFFEAFEAFDNVNDPMALSCLKNQLLCRVMTSHTADVQAILNGKYGVKYGGIDLQAIRAINVAAGDRSLEKFIAARAKYAEQLVGDRFVQRHLDKLYDMLMESNLVKILEPYSRVELAHVANLINLPLDDVELKLSQMILDKKFDGTLDQGKGELVVFDPVTQDKAYPAALSTVENMNLVLDSLFTKAAKLN